MRNVLCCTLAPCDRYLSAVTGPQAPGPFWDHLVSLLKTQGVRTLPGCCLPSWSQAPPLGRGRARPCVSSARAHFSIERLPGSHLCAASTAQAGQAHLPYPRRWGRGPGRIPAQHDQAACEWGVGPRGPDAQQSPNRQPLCRGTTPASAPQGTPDSQRQPAEGGENIPRASGTRWALRPLPGLEAAGIPRLSGC